MAEITPISLGANYLAGVQNTQALKDARQQNELRAMQMQAAQAEAERAGQTRQALAAYMSGGSNGLAALYATDPEVAMKAETFVNERNAFQRNQQVEQAKQTYTSARYVLESDAPKLLTELQFPKLVEQMKSEGFDWENATDDDIRRIAGTVAAQAGSLAGIAPEQATAEVRTLEALSKNPTLLETELKLRNASRPSTQVTIDQKANLKAEEKFAELEATEFSAVLQRGQLAEEKSSQLRAMRDSPAVTGTTQDMRAAVNSFFADLGVPISQDKLDQIGNIAQYRGIANDLVLREQLKQKGPQTESDAKRIMASFGQTKNIQEANRMIVNYQLALADRESVLAQMAEEYRDKHGSIDGWRKDLRAYIRSTPLAAVNPKSKRLVFWNEFQEQMKQANPSMSDDEIMEQWRAKYR